jgi:hypothetical protein
MTAELLVTGCLCGPGCSFHHIVSTAQNVYTLADDSVAQAASSQSGGAFGFLADGFEAFLKVQLAGIKFLALQFQAPFLNHASNSVGGIL